jgi:hypothetical protein
MPYSGMLCPVALGRTNVLEKPSKEISSQRAVAASLVPS